MTKVVIDMTMSLDGFVAGPDDGVADPLGRHGGEHLFDWYFSGSEEYRDPVFRPEPGANLDEVSRMFAESGAFIFGRRTYEIAGGWGGRHPVNGVPVFVLTHDPPADYPRRISRSSPTASKAPSARRGRWRMAGTSSSEVPPLAIKRFPPDSATRS